MKLQSLIIAGLVAFAGTAVADTYVKIGDAQQIKAGYTLDGFASAEDAGNAAQASLAALENGVFPDAHIWGAGEECRDMNNAWNQSRLARVITSNSFYTVKGGSYTLGTTYDASGNEMHSVTVRVFMPCWLK